MFFLLHTHYIHLHTEMFVIFQNQRYFFLKFKLFMPQLLKVNTNRFSSRSIIQVHVAIASILNGKEECDF